MGILLFTSVENVEVQGLKILTKVIISFMKIRGNVNVPYVMELEELLFHMLKK